MWAHEQVLLIGFSMGGLLTVTQISQGTEQSAREGWKALLSDFWGGSGKTAHLDRERNWEAERKWKYKKVYCMFQGLHCCSFPIMGQRGLTRSAKQIHRLWTWWLWLLSRIANPKVKRFVYQSQSHQSLFCLSDKPGKQEAETETLNWMFQAWELCAQKCPAY